MTPHRPADPHQFVRQGHRGFVVADTFGPHYKRHYKTARGFSGKNVELFLGNFVSLLARERVGAKKAFDRLKEWECWPVIRDHYAAKDLTEFDIYKHIKNLLEERHVRWGRAV